MARSTHQRFAHDPATAQISKARHARLPSAVAALLLLCGALAAPAALAQTAPAGSGPAQSPGAEATGRPQAAGREAQKQPADLSASIPDVEVVDQDGRKVRFYSDLIEGKVFVVSFVFTTCTFVCPMQGESLSRLQAALGERLGREVNLISISTDPARDTPERLRAWGARFHAKPGWTLVTGREADIAALAKAFTGAATFKGEHSPVLFIGSDHKATWVRAYGLSGPSAVGSFIDEMAAGRAPEPGAK